MLDIMVDLETLDTIAGAALVSIGAVAFSRVPGEPMTGLEFYCLVCPESCAMRGLTINEETRLWWNDQTPDVQQTLEDAEESGFELPIALGLLTGFLNQFDLDQVRIWGNGANFDNAVLEYAYRAIGVQFPWKHWNSRCFRTLKNEWPGDKALTPTRYGTQHNALDDAMTQGIHAALIFRYMYARPVPITPTP